MRRIRVALLILSLAILLPVGLLTWRALEGLAYERAARHQVVAERSFEEMERALSEFLAREEARPAAHYRLYLEGSGERSPLSLPAPEPFVVGAFELSGDGRVSTVLAPDDAAGARVRRAVRDGFEAAPAKKEAQLAKAAEAQRPEGEAAAGAPAPPSLEPRKDAADSTVYDILQSFNVASRERALEERKQKLADAETLKELDRSVASEWRESPAPSAAQQAPALQGAPAAASPPAAPSEPAWQPALLEPMSGRLAGERALLLVRTVQSGRETLRQGLVLDREALAAWLSERGLAPGGLAQRARLRFPTVGEATAPPPADGADFVFRHRFTDPFDALVAQLELTALPGVGSPGAVYALVALLLALGAAGIFALHRMVSVVVGFAERRSNFVAAVTHELKTPLTAIRMYAEMLRDGLVPNDAKRGEYYRTITDESERLSRLIDNVLEFARLERGSRELTMRAGDVAPVLEEALAKLRSHAAREGFELVLSADAGLPPVQFDRDALLQVLFNLVDNAMKYARGAAARSVRIEARRAGEGVEVAVRDFGPGVAPKHLSRIFEPFYRGEDELVRSTQGTGIGLALVRELAARMGASVAGANAPEGGFRVSLAFRAAPAS
jgi:signal transduction histidine kinase